MENQRPTKRIKLSNCEVEIITYITWGEKEAIQSSVLKNASVGEDGKAVFDTSALLSSKKTALSLAIKKIIYSDGLEKPYTDEFMDNLSIEDGDLLYEEVNEVTKPKKKETSN